MLEKKSIDKIFQMFTPLKKEEGLNLDFSSDLLYEDFLKNYKTFKFSEDIILLSYKECLKENSYLEKEYNSFSMKFWMIATSGQGDAWFLNKTDSFIYFYDHNNGEYEVEKIMRIGITFSQFLQLSDIIRQVEEHMDKDAMIAEDDYKMKMNEILNELSEIYPYNYF